MLFMMDYSKGSVNGYPLIDMKSFYASVGYIERNLDLLTTKPVIMSRADNIGPGLILASSPEAKKRYGITSVSRPRDLLQPFPKTLHVVLLRMSLYIKRNMQVNNTFRRYVVDEDLLIYSTDEPILKMIRSSSLFTTEGTRSQRRRKPAQMVQENTKEELGLIATVGAGDNPLSTRLALDNKIKHNEGFIAEWTYKNVPEKVWNIPEMADFWGTDPRMKKRLNQMGTMNIRDLASWDPYTIKNRLGVIGLRLCFRASGIDRTNMAIPPEPTREKSYGNSQVLPRGYTGRNEVELMVKEIAEQVAIRIRQRNCKTGCIHLHVGTPILETRPGLSHQVGAPITDNTRELQSYCLFSFDKYYGGREVRHIGITYSKFVYTDSLQLDLFNDPQKQIDEENLDKIIDKIRQEYGFTSIVRALSVLKGAGSVTRSTLVNGHTGGNGEIKSD